MTSKEALESLKYEVYEEGHCSYIEEELGIAIKALEKQIPKKPTNIIYRMNGYNGKCPICNRSLIKTAYCPGCGQKLDWQFEERN